MRETVSDETIAKAVRALDDDENPTARDETAAMLDRWINVENLGTPDQQQLIRSGLAVFRNRRHH